MVQAFVVHYIEPYYSYYTVYTLLLLLFTQTKSLNPVQSIKRKKKKKKIHAMRFEVPQFKQFTLVQIRNSYLSVNVNGHVLMK